MGKQGNTNPGDLRWLSSSSDEIQQKEEEMEGKGRSELIWASCLQRLSVSLTGSTGYPENRLNTDTLTHGGTLFTLHTAPSDTHPLNGWSLVVIGKTHTNTHTHTGSHTQAHKTLAAISLLLLAQNVRGVCFQCRAVLVGVLYHVLCDVCQNVQPFDTCWGKHTEKLQCSPWRFASNSGLQSRNRASGRHRIYIYCSC